MMPAAAEPKPSRDVALLAPAFRAAVEGAIAECNRAGYDAMVYEASRSEELQAIYYRRGRDVFPPHQTVTNAKSALYSWHGFGLAVDVISRSKLWSPAPGWFRAVGAIFKRHGCDWGGDWARADLPHMQWGRLRISPSDNARRILRQQGLTALWREVGAVDVALSIPAIRRILTKGLVGADVGELQGRLGAPVTETFDAITDAWVRGFQRGKGLRVDGDVGQDVRSALGV